MDGQAPRFEPMTTGALLDRAFRFPDQLGYYVFFEGLGRSSTPGKRLVGIRVIHQDGLPVGLRETALRAIYFFCAGRDRAPKKNF